MSSQPIARLESTEYIRRRLSDIETNLIRLDVTTVEEETSRPNSPSTVSEITPLVVRRKKPAHEKHVAQLIEVIEDFKKILHLQNSADSRVIGDFLEEEIEDGWGRERRTSLLLVPMQDKHILECILVLLGGVCLSFNSGFVNGVTLSASLHLPSSHVTGTMSHAGMAYSTGNKSELTQDVLLMLFFAGGAALAGGIVSRKSFQIELGTDYLPLLTVEVLLLIGACIAEFI
jgi:Protein of unknown function (DUF1275)